MTLFDDEGFLSDELDSFRRQICGNHPRWFEFLRDFNLFSMKKLRQLDIRSKNRQSILIGSFSIKLLQDIQVAVLCLERGAVIQAQPILRNAFEALVLMKEFTKTDESARQFFGRCDVERIKLLKSALSDPLHPLRKYFSEMELNQKIFEAEKDIRELKINRTKINIRDLATKNFLKEHYNLIYHQFSHSTHSTPQLLNRILKGDPKKDNLTFVFAPETNDLEGELSFSAELMLRMWEHISLHFNLQNDPEALLLEKKYFALAKQPVPRRDK